MDTIFATATAQGKSGVAIIRISGANAGKALELLTCKKLPEPRWACLNKIYNPANGELIDEALILWFKAPASFTGENVAELHVHGGRAIITEILSCLSKIDKLRMAEPGEFSRRAFLNNKMDLTEAEGLADLINAETKIQARLAMRQKQGDLGKLYDIWREDILYTLAYIEAYIDFPDEDIPLDVIDKIENKVNGLVSILSNYINDNRRGERIRDGLNIAIIGPPNAGKSSLLNLLAMRNVAIVSERAGTTRDVIEVQLDVGGYAISIADTAGIHETIDEIECEGIKRALAKAASADLKLIVLDAVSICNNDGEGQLKEFFDLFDNNTILVANKIDLLKENNNLSEVFGLKPIAASFKNGIGIENILALIKQFAVSNFDYSGDPLITHARHRILLEEAFVALKSFSLSKNIELASEDLRIAATAIGKITGRINVEEVLDRIFSSFCIGK